MEGTALHITAPFCSLQNLHGLIKKTTNHFLTLVYSIEHKIVSLTQTHTHYAPFPQCKMAQLTNHGLHPDSTHHEVIK